MQGLLAGVNFDLMYSYQKKASTHKNKDRATWDKRAKEMNSKIHEGHYNDVIRKKVDLSSAKTLLDVGCGPGTFALCLAKNVEHVYAFDFSTQMLACLEENKKLQNIKNISGFQADIEDSWDDIPVCDVVLASRCMEVNNLAKTLANLDAHAKQAVYMTFKVGSSFLSEILLHEIGKEVVPRPDYIYVLNILYQMGIFACVEFITPLDKRCCEGPSMEEYVEAISWSLDGISDEEANRARRYYKRCKDEGIEPELRDNRWALISWKKPCNKHKGCK
ncbi:MAG: methyltransferase domain-containing protein [Campylobacterales bacterium]|jgi:FkbM family methyltransferase|nr:methyltransferase domain-containing protein [Campylobacterales bacterium]